jgi:hypothetical protein
MCRINCSRRDIPCQNRITARNRICCDFHLPRVKETRGRGGHSPSTWLGDDMRFKSNHGH